MFDEVWDVFVEMFTLSGILLAGAALFAFCLAYLMNPDFWQGLRNSLFLDKLKKEQMKCERELEERYEQSERS
ncbi:MAG: hypothetical protein J5700_01425 [Treponema sp.]|nr:hypothetical protein [Treponema sp.]